jgi:hypothetical protein
MACVKPAATMTGSLRVWVMTFFDFCVNIFHRLFLYLSLSGLLTSLGYLYTMHNPPPCIEKKVVY